MARNLSVTQFQQLMARIPKEVANELRGVVEDAGSKLARAMLFASPHGDTGNLARSIRVEPSKHPLRVVVRAGGPLTHTPQGTDYALHVEYGTEKMPARSFFWATYRAKKKSLRAEISRKAKPALAKVVNIT